MAPPVRSGSSRRGPGGAIRVSSSGLAQRAPDRGGTMDVVVASRHCQLTDAFRDHVSEKLNSLEKLKERIIRAEVMVTCSDAKRQPEQAVRVEITLNGKGPVVRAEAAADDKMVAFEHALDRLKTQLLRASDRRKVHRGLRGGASVKALEPTPVEATIEDTDVRTVAGIEAVSYTHLRAHETVLDLVCRLLL